LKLLRHAVTKKTDEIVDLVETGETVEIVDSVETDEIVRRAYSSDSLAFRRRALRDVSAASDAAAAKRRRYAEASAALVPFALEAGGRPSDEAAAFVRLCGSAYTQTNRSEDGTPAPSPTGRLWQELSTTLQLGNAEILLSAIGH